MTIRTPRRKIGISAIAALTLAVAGNAPALDEVAEAESSFANGLGELHSETIETYDLHAVTTKLVLSPRGFSPYAGIGVGLNFSDLGKPEISERRRFGLRDYFSVRAGAVGFAGIQYRLRGNFRFFSEARAGAAIHIFGGHHRGGAPVPGNILSAIVGMKMGF